MCFGGLCLIRLMFTQFDKTEGGVCGHRGRPVQWPVEKDRSPGFDTAMHPCHSWGAKTVREVGERLSAALPSHVPVSISALQGNTQKQHLHYSSVRVEKTDFLVPHGSPAATFLMCLGLTSFLSFRKLKSAQYGFSCSIKFQASDSLATFHISDFKCRRVLLKYLN